MFLLKNTLLFASIISVKCQGTSVLSQSNLQVCAKKSNGKDLVDPTCKDKLILLLSIDSNTVSFFLKLFFLSRWWVNLQLIWKLKLFKIHKPGRISKCINQFIYKFKRISQDGFTLFSILDKTFLGILLKL